MEWGYAVSSCWNGSVVAISQGSSGCPSEDKKECPCLCWITRQTIPRLVANHEVSLSMSGKNGKETDSLDLLKPPSEKRIVYFIFLIPVQ